MMRDTARHFWTNAATSAAVLASTIVATGCTSPAFFDGFEVLNVDQGVLDMAAAVDPDDPMAAQGVVHPVVGAFVQTEFWLDFDAPTALELEELQPPGADPAMQTPWVQQGDLELSIQWKLTNESDQMITAFVTLDGATEFFDYNPIAMFGAAGGEDADEIAFPSLLGFFPRDMEPNEVITGEFREDDMIEAVYDLDVLSRFCGGPLAVVHNRSEVDPIGTDMVPPDATIAGMVMIRLTLGANAPVSLEYAIRVRDSGSILFDDRTDTMRFEPVPMPVPLAAGGGGGMMGMGMPGFCGAAAGGA